AADGEALANGAPRVDQVRDAQREGRVLIIELALGRIHATDGVIDIGEKGEAKPLGFGPRLVLRGRVERDTDDGAAGHGEVVEAVPEFLSLDGAPKSARLRIPPQQHPAAAE